MLRKALVLALAVGLTAAAGCAQEKTADDITGAVAEEQGAGSTIFELESRAFADGEAIPPKYANNGFPGGENLSVPLSWKGTPEGVKSFALVCVDRNETANNWIHWAIINIPANAESIPEGASGTAKMPLGSIELNNTFGKKGWGGPTPPAGTGPHEYEFTLYALACESLDMPAQPTIEQFEEKVKEETLEAATLTGVVEGGG